MSLLRSLAARVSPPPPFRAGSGAILGRRGVSSSVSRGIATRRSFASSTRPSPSPPPPRPKKHPRQAILAAACAASVLIGIFSEVLWYKFSPHAAAAAGATSTSGTAATTASATGRSVHAEAATAPATTIAGEDEHVGNALLAARLAHLTHLSSLPLYDAYRSDTTSASAAGLSISDAVRALVRALPDDATSPGEVSSDVDTPALPSYLSPLTSLLTAAALANGSIASDPLLTQADLHLIGKLVSTPVVAYTTAFRVLDVDGGGTLSADELKRAVTTACGPAAMWPSSSDEVSDDEWVRELFPQQHQIALHDFSAFLTSLRRSLSSAIYSTHASADNGTVMTGADFAWVLLAMYTSAGDDVLGARARLVQVASDARVAQAVVSKEEWAAFDELAHRTGEFLEAVRVVSSVTEMQVRGDRTIDSELFLRASRAIGVYLSPVQIDVMCRVLDTNGDGRLSVLEFLRLSDSLTSLGLSLSPAHSHHKLHSGTMDPSAPLAQILRSSTGSSVLDILRELPERTARWWSCVQSAPGPWTVGAKEGSGGCRQH